MRGRLNGAAATGKSIKCEKSLFVPGLLLAAGGNAAGTASIQMHTIEHKRWNTAINEKACAHIDVCVCVKQTRCQANKVNQASMLHAAFSSCKSTQLPVVLNHSR